MAAPTVNLSPMDHSDAWGNFQRVQAAIKALGEYVDAQIAAVGVPVGGGVTDHGALTGLADDDHTIYAKADGSRGNFETTGAAAAAVSAHEAAGDPHPDYASEASVTALVNAFIDHEAAADPHPGYQQESERNNASGYCGLGASGKVAPAQLYTFVGTLGSDATTGANTTPIDLTGLVFSYEASSTYRIWFMGDVDPAAATTGCGFQLNLSSTVTSVSLSFYHQLANTGTLSGGHSIADDASVGVSSGLPGTSQYPVVGEARLITNGNTGTAQLRFRSETTAAITCKAGMTLVVEKVA